MATLVHILPSQRGRSSAWQLLKGLARCDVLPTMTMPSKVDVIVCLVDAVWVHKLTTASIFIWGDILGVLLAFTRVVRKDLRRPIAILQLSRIFSFLPGFRYRLHAALHRYFKETERTAAAAGVVLD